MGCLYCIQAAVTGRLTGTRALTQGFRAQLRQQLSSTATITVSVCCGRSLAPGPEPVRARAAGPAGRPRGGGCNSRSAGVGPHSGWQFPDNSSQSVKLEVRASHDFRVYPGRE